MHLRGILLVFFRVLLVGFGLFGLGTARAPKIFFSRYNNQVVKIDIVNIISRGY